MSQKIRLLIIAVLLLVFCGWTNASAQLPRDVRDVFEGMLSDLEKDLADKFQAAIDKDSATVEFTPEQFRRFRDNPVNPFEGLDQINALDGGGNIALKFELPSLRNRTMHPFERQSDSIRQSVQIQVGSIAASTVRVFNDDRQVALGIVVDKNGLIVTKASEVENESSIVCHLPDGRQLPARIVRSDKPNDVALLSVEANDLIKANFTPAETILGEFVLTPDFDGTVLTIGTYSAGVRSTKSGEQAFLGVQPQTTPQGVVINDVRPAAASYLAGLRNNDVITSLGGNNISDVNDLVREIRKRRPGDRVAINFLRNGASNTVYAELAGQNVSGERAARFKMMNRLGTIPSRRADGFPAVFQHDSPLFPEQCGGPIVDLDGNLLGMNIARNGRAASYAIPWKKVQKIVNELNRENVALRSAKQRSRQN